MVASRFPGHSSPNAVEKALQRLANSGAVRRPYRGLYDKPGTSRLTGKMLFPPRSSYVDAIARRDKLRVLVDGMTAANDLGLTTAVPARSTIYADTYPRTIEIEANIGDPAASTPVIYTLDFKRIAARTAFWAGRPAMRIVQALSWFRDDQSGMEAVINGITRHLSKSPQRREIVDDLSGNVSALPAWMYPLVNAIVAHLPASDEKNQSDPDSTMKDDHASNIH